MTFVRGNPPGWALFELLLSSQMNTIDSQLPFALDGQSGGTYQPTNPIELNSASVLGSEGAIKMTGNAAVDRNYLIIEGGNNMGLPASTPRDLLDVLGNNNTSSNKGGGAIRATAGNGVNDGGDALTVFGGDSTGAGDGGSGIEAFGGDALSNGDGGYGMVATGGQAVGANAGGVGLRAVGALGASGGTGGRGIEAFGGASTLPGTTGGGPAIYAIGGNSDEAGIQAGYGVQARSGTNFGSATRGAAVYVDQGGGGFGMEFSSTALPGSGLRPRTVNWNQYLPHQVMEWPIPIGGYTPEHGSMTPVAKAAGYIYRESGQLPMIEFVWSYNIDTVNWSILPAGGTVIPFNGDSDGNWANVAFVFSHIAGIYDPTPLFPDRDGFNHGRYCSLNACGDDFINFTMHDPGGALIDMYTDLTNQSVGFQFVVFSVP